MIHIHRKINRGPTCRSAKLYRESCPVYIATNLIGESLLVADVSNLDSIYVFKASCHVSSVGCETGNYGWGYQLFNPPMDVPTRWVGSQLIRLLIEEVESPERDII
jgi:hypothetical protein